MSEELNVLKEVASRLNDAAIHYMISGSVAMNFYAQPRMTRDIDIVVVLEPKNIKRFVLLFERDFYIDEEMIKMEVERNGMFNLIHNKFVIKIDFILQKNGEFYECEFGRKRRIDVDGVKIWIISPEDLVLSKLYWAKDSRSELQLRDVKNILDMVKNLDVNYIAHWVSRLGVSDIYKEAEK